MDRSVSIEFFFICLVLLLSLGAADSAAIAQDNLVDMAATNAQRTCTDPSLESGARCPAKVQAKLSATREDTKATLEVGWKRNSPNGSSELLYGLTLSGPIGKSATQAELASFDGLGNAANLAFGLHWLSSNPVKQFELTRKAWKTQNAGQAFDSHVIDECAALLGMTGACDTDDLLKLGKDQWLTFMRETLGLRGSWLVGLEATVGSEKFDFANAETLADQNRTEESFKGSLSGGYLPLGTHTYYIGGTYTYQETYSGNPATDICQPLRDGGTLQCKSVALGAPEKKSESLATIELRRYFNTANNESGVKRPWAINPSLTWNLDSEELGVALPFYFFTDTKGNLNGGLSIEWRTDTDEVVVRAFLGGLSDLLGFRKPDD